MTEFASFVPTQRFNSIALSPDGTTLAYSSNANGQYNLWLHQLVESEPRQITRFTDRAVRDVSWSPDSDRLLLAADNHGDEQYQLYLVAAEGGEPELLTAAADRQHLPAADPFSPDGRYLLYSVNDRDITAQDLIIRDLNEGRTQRFVPPTGVMLAPVGLSPDGRWLLTAGLRSNTDCQAYLIDLHEPEPALRPLAVDAGGYTEPSAWAGNDGFYLRTNRKAEFLHLVYYAVATGTWSVVETAPWDVEDVAVSGDGSTVVWAINEAGRSIVHVRRYGHEVLFPAVPDGVVKAIRLSDDGRTAALLFDSAVRPAEILVADLDAGDVRYITDTRPPALRTIQPVPAQLVRYPTYDGRDITGFLYRPTGSGPRPVLLSIHGGPEYQERPAYSALYQYLLANGIGVFAPNFRGSTGYGLTFQKLVHRDWGGGDLADLEHAAKYLRSLDWVDAARIAVYGGSYGGFAALSCLSRLPGQFAAGVSVCGPTNLKTLAEAAPPTWRSFITEMLGDPEADADHLLSRSPITHAHHIATPLFIIQGAKDPRVPRTEAEQIVQALRDRDIPVRYDLYEDEGHGFTNRTNELQAQASVADFLREALSPSHEA